jgi:hypothetical protein
MVVVVAVVVVEGGNPIRLHHQEGREGRSDGNTLG